MFGTAFKSHYFVLLHPIHIFETHSIFQVPNQEEYHCLVNLYKIPDLKMQQWYLRCLCY